MSVMWSVCHLHHVHMSLEHVLLLHSVMDRLKSVPVAAFSAHVRSMHQDRDKGFEHEYQVRSFLGSCACHLKYFLLQFFEPPKEDFFKSDSFH